MSIFSKIAEQMTAPRDGEDPKDAGDQSPDEKKLISYVRQKIDQVRQTNSRITQEGLAFTNLSYLLGYDGVYYDTVYKQFRNIDPKRRLSRNRFRINKILPTVQNRLSRLTQAPPKWDVRPNSDSSEDKDCARLGAEIIDFILEKQTFTEKRQDMLMSCMQAGIAYIQVHWDDQLGEPMYDPESKKLIGYEGDVRIEPLTFFEVYSDPLAKSLTDSQWVIKAKVRKLDYFKERYERGQLVKEEDAWLQSSLWDLKANAITATGIAGAQTSEQTKNAAIELVYYEKRSKDYPDGRMIVIANGILLEDKEMPIGEFDIVKFDDVLIGGRYHSEAIITHLRPIQDQYNITRTKMADWIRKMLAGKYMVAKGAGLSQEALNDESGEVLEFNPVPGAPPPTALMMPQIPSFVYEDVKTLDNEFDFVSGMYDVMRGDAPSSSMPFRGMALLVEQSQTRISVQAVRNEVGYAKIGSCILKYVGKYYQVPRLMKVAGDGLEYAVKEFKGQDLKGNYDVIVVPGSTVPNSKVLKRQDIINAYQMGLLGDPADPKLRAKVLKMMEFGDVAEMWKEQALDDQQVKKTIEAIQAGEEPPMHEWDNHEVFIQEMNNFRKTDKFDEMSEEQRGMFNYVAEWHVQALVSLQNPEVAQQQTMAQHMVDVTQRQMAQGPPPGVEQAMAQQPMQAEPPALMGA